MLFIGREARIGKNRARDRGQSFSQYGPTKAGEQHFYLFRNSIFRR